jgi:replicative DNA helicase
MDLTTPHRGHERSIGDLLINEQEQLSPPLRSAAPASGILTGLAALDRFLAPLQPATLYAIAARAGGGKTALALCIAQAGITRPGGRVGLIATETNEQHLRRRWLSLENGIEPAQMFARTPPAASASRARTATDRGIHAPVVWAVPPLLSVEAVEDAARRWMRQARLRLLIVDSRCLFWPASAAIAPRDHVETLARRLKYLARSLSIPLLLTVPLSAPGPRREESRPQLADLDEGMEWHADVVILIHRQQRADPQPTRKELADLIIARNRFGPSGRITVRFDAATGQFHDA